MNRMTRFSSAALGMVLLAGLALYQGRVEVTPGEEDVLVGTALAESAEIKGSECEDTASADGEVTDPCVEEESLADNN